MNGRKIYNSGKLGKVDQRSVAEKRSDIYLAESS
jgi:hypothetical protein